MLGRGISFLLANSLDKERGLLKFIENTIEKTPIERGELLGYDDMIAQSHEASAKKGQTVP